MPAAGKASGFRLRRAAEQAASDLPGLLGAAEKAVQDILTGTHRQRRAGPGETFWQFRDYTPSDRPQDIDWRQSAKGDQVFIREKEKQNAQTLALWCASGPGMDFHSTAKLPAKAWRAKVITMALALLAVRSHEKIAALGSGLMPGRSEKTIGRIGEHLLEDQPRALSGLHFLELPANCAAVLAADFLDPVEEIEATVAALAAQATSGILIQVLDPAEIDLPYSGRVTFLQPGAPPLHETIDNVASVRGRYHERMQRHIESIRDLCRKRGWAHFLHVTDDDIRRTLFSVWSHMHAGRAADGGGMLP